MRIPGWFVIVGAVVMGIVLWCLALSVLQDVAARLALRGLVR